MIIDTANYLNSTMLQMTQKNEAKNSGSELGKTQQNGTSSSLDQINLGEDGIAIAEVERTQESGQTGVQARSAAPRMDTVEISAEGLAALSRSESASSADSVEADTYEYEAEDLSEYTDSELKQMYYRGDITPQEYEEQTGETLDAE